MKVGLPEKLQLNIYEHGLLRGRLQDELTFFLHRWC